MGFLILDTNTEDDRVFLFILSEIALEIVRFFCAAAGEILGIKIQHHPFALEIAEADRFAFLRIHDEVRSGRTCWGRLLSGAHRADDNNRNEQNSYSNDDPNHFHLVNSMTALHPYSF